MSVIGSWVLPVGYLLHAVIIGSDGQVCPPFKSTLTEAAPSFAAFEEPALSAVEGGSPVCMVNKNRLLTLNFTAPHHDRA